MRLRAHHLLCLMNFIGEGYSDGFTRNMAACRRRLEAEDAFTLARGADDICAACPHRRGEGCVSQEKVLRYDAALEGLLGLARGERCSAAALQRRIRTEIFESGGLREICGDCEWYPLCAEICEKKEEERWK